MNETLAHAAHEPRAAAEGASARPCPRVAFGRPLSGIPTPVLRKIDTDRTLRLSVEVSERMSALPDAVFESATAAAAVEALQEGWTVYRSPGSREPIAVLSPIGWAYQPSGAALDHAWTLLSITRRRSALTEILVAESMAFESMGAWAETMLQAALPRLRRGVWRVLEERLGREEFETVQFLYRLGGGAALRGALAGQE